jgi:hypothetical protein
MDNKSIDPETEAVKAISYSDYVELCRLNGFEYIVVIRKDYIPIIDFFEWRKGSVVIPCRNRENGRGIIFDFIGDGICGKFYIRRMIFPEDNYLTQVRKFLIRYDPAQMKLKLTKGK